MGKIGLLISIFEAVNAIDFSRKGFATRGEEQKGRICHARNRLVDRTFGTRTST